MPLPDQLTTVVVELEVALGPLAVDDLRFHCELQHGKRDGIRVDIQRQQIEVVVGVACQVVTRIVRLTRRTAPERSFGRPFSADPTPSAGRETRGASGLTRSRDVPVSVHHAG